MSCNCCMRFLGLGNLPPPCGSSCTGHGVLACCCQDFVWVLVPTQDPQPRRLQVDAGEGGRAAAQQLGRRAAAAPATTRQRPLGSRKQRDPNCAGAACCGVSVCKRQCLPAPATAAQAKLALTCIMLQYVSLDDCNDRCRTPGASGYVLSAGDIAAEEHAPQRRPAAVAAR